MLYGLNLPARNIFLLKPTTGRNTAISGPDFWNLSGRAGRLGKELEGNVYLIDYNRWETKPVSESRNVRVTSGLRTTIVDKADRLLAFLDDPQVSSEKEPELEIALGKLVIDERNGTLDRTIARYVTEENSAKTNAIFERVKNISANIPLPSDVLNKNIGVSIFRQNDLLGYMIKRIKEIGPEELMPAHPLIDFEIARKNYERAFKRIHTYLLKYPGKNRQQFFFAPLALRWMRGDPLPVLIDSAIKYNQKNKTGRSTARIIRDTMENVEDDLRFRYVKFFTCYNSILEFVLAQEGLKDLIQAIPNVPLFLEMGGSSGAMINLMAIGLSRTTAEALTIYITNKEMGLDEVKLWLLSQKLESLDISPACIREAQELIGKLGPVSDGQQ